jgi:membrane protein DedA with SNARE-associated domain
VSSNWILNWIEDGGYLAVALLMLLENVFPPIPSEIVMPVAGIVAGRGDLNIGLVIVFGTLGAVVGQLLWYWLGLRVGDDGLKRLARRHGRWLTVSPDDIDKADDWFDKHGGKAVLIGRMVPGVRTLISLPAGLSEMSLQRFLVYSSIGSGGWTTALGLIGYALGERSDSVTSWIGPVSTTVFAGIVAYYLYRVATFRKDASPRGRSPRQAARPSP